MKKITVLDFCNQIGAASDEIPVIVKFGSTVAGTFCSLYRIPAQAAPGLLESKINFVTLARGEITIQVTPKDYNSRKPCG